MVRNLTVGDRIKGLDDTNSETWCTVAAVSYTGVGELYGNYTRYHLVLNESSSEVVEHGAVGPRTVDSLHRVLTDCPFAIDEAGTKFSAMGNYNRPVSRRSLTVEDHLTVHMVLLELVRRTGTFWMSEAIYGDVRSTRLEAPEIIDLMIQCLDEEDANATTCVNFELAAAQFVDTQFSSTAGAAAGSGTSGSGSGSSGSGSSGSGSGAGGSHRGESYSEVIHRAFPGLGHAGKPGSVSFAARQTANREDINTMHVVVGTVVAVVIIGVAVVIFIVYGGRKAKKYRDLRVTERKISPVETVHADVDTDLVDVPDVPTTKIAWDTHAETDEVEL
jgi:hypothetical protein